MRLCSASDLQEEEDQFSDLQAQILTSSGNSFDLSQPLMLSGPVFLPVGWILEPVLPVESPVIGIPVSQ